MSRRVRALLGLVLALGALEGLLLLQRPRARQAEPLLDLAPAQVARLEIARAGRPPLVLARREAGWVVASHGELPAAGEAVQGMLQRLLSWRRERRGSSERASWAAAQVSDEAARHVRLLGPGGELLGDLRVGAITGIEPEDVREQGYALDTSRLGLFVRLAGEDATWVVTEFVTRELEPDPRPWFPRPLLVPSRERLLRLGIARGAERCALALQGPPRLEPSGLPAEPAAVFGLLQALESLETLGPAPSGPPDGALHLVLEAQEQPPLEAWAWAGADGRTFFRAGGLDLEVARFAGERVLQAGPATLLRRRVLPCGRGAVERLELGAAGAVTALVRVPGGWQRERAGQAPRALQAAALEPALRALEELQVQAWDPAAPEPPPGSPLVAWAGGGARGGLRLGALEGARRAARLEDGPPAWVDAAGAAALLEALEALTRD